MNWDRPERKSCYVNLDIGSSLSRRFKKLDLPMLLHHSLSSGGIRNLLQRGKCNILACTFSFHRQLLSVS